MSPSPASPTLTERLGRLPERTERTGRLEAGPAAGLAAVVEAIAGAVREIAAAVDRSTVAGVRGPAGSTNVHGEAQLPLDLTGNDIMLRALAGCPDVAAVVSEELPDVQISPGARDDAPFLVAFDPLDGSSNLDANVGVGTIFSVLPRPPASGVLTGADFLVPGTEQIAAGFALYGPSTILVLTTGDGVDGFTLDRASGEFVLSHPRITIPAACTEYAINASNERFWEPPVQRYVQECVAGRGGPRERDFNTRWVASLVAETFRILMRGGVFLYPRDTKDPARAGRLRSVYECSPIAYVVEQASGRASTGRERTMAHRPAELHERAPFVFGSREEVDRIERYHRAGDLTPEAARTFDASLFNNRSLFRVS